MLLARRVGRDGGVDARVLERGGILGSAAYILDGVVNGRYERIGVRNAGQVHRDFYFVCAREASALEVEIGEAAGDFGPLVGGVGHQLLDALAGTGGSGGRAGANVDR